MIKNSTYIRSFTDKQRQQLQSIQDKEKIKTVPDILFFALDQYSNQLNEINRLKNIINFKNQKLLKKCKPT
jgi:hypothetical protein